MHAYKPRSGGQLANYCRYIGAAIDQIQSDQIDILNIILPLIHYDDILIDIGDFLMLFLRLQGLQFSTRKYIILHHNYCSKINVFTLTFNSSDLGLKLFDKGINGGVLGLLKQI